MSASFSSKAPTEGNLTVISLDGIAASDEQVVVGSGTQTISVTSSVPYYIIFGVQGAVPDPAEEPALYSAAVGVDKYRTHSGATVFRVAGADVGTLSWLVE